jgi:hypothetical protein
MVFLLFDVLDAAFFLASGAVAAPVVIVEISLARRPRLGKTPLPVPGGGPPAGRAPVSGTRGRLRRPVLSS